MKYAKIFLAVLAIASLFVISCAPKAGPVATPGGQTPDLSKGGGVTPLKQGWEAEWERVKEAGKKEGTVSIYATLIAPSIREKASFFKQKFGIDLDVTAGRGADMSQKLLRERAGGVFLADVVIAGLNTFFGEVKKAGVTEPMPNKLILPEVIDPKLFYRGDQLPWADDDKHIFTFFAYPNRDIAINTDLVRPEEIQSWQDLLDPKFRGKILWSDPSISGSGFNGFSTLLLNKVTDEDYYRKMVATQQVQLTRDLRLMVDWLARGKVHVTISAEGGPIAEFLRAGAHIATVAVKEGTYLSVDAGNVSIAARSPHPNAAKVFVNWLLSKEGQLFAQEAMKYQSSRIDLPTDMVNPLQVRKPGERYYIGANSVEKWVLEDQDKYIALARDIFGPLIGR